jgi:hypothetical protein
MPDLPIKINMTAIIKVRMYPLTGSWLFPKPFPKNSRYGKILSLQRAWNTFGALTKLAKALDKVAFEIKTKK